MGHGSNPSESLQADQMGQTVFSKAKEFGGDEKMLARKLDCLDNLLHNYAGLGGMKNDFASMMYASGMNFSMTKSGLRVGSGDIMVKKDVVKPPDKIDDELQS